MSTIRRCRTNKSKDSVFTAPFEKTAYIAAVGGANVDIGARSESALVPGDSNPGRIRVNPGGVCRNIAHNMALMGLKVEMMTALGDDLYANLIADSCAKLGVDLGQTVRIPGTSTSSYCYIANHEGEMVLAVSDMEIYNQLTPQLLEPKLDWLNSADAVVLDTNLTEEAVAWRCKNVAVPVFADPVSTAKAVKLRPVLSGVHTLKPNRLEAEVLTGVKISDEESLNRAADVLLDTGVKRVFLTLGSGGVLAADTESRIRLSSPGVIPVNTTGCGDAFAAALVWATVQGKSLAECAVAGLAAAGIAMGGTETVNPLMSPERLENEIYRLTELQED